MMFSWEHRALFLHPPKTGGFAVRHMLWERFGFARPPGLTDWHSPFIPDADDHHELGYGRYAGWLVFGTVRNPYARLVSMWGHMLAERHNPGWQDAWSYAAGREDFPGFAAAFLSQGPPPMFQPLTTTLARCDRILRQETLVADFNTLPFVAEPVTLPRKNEHPHPPWPECYDAATAALVRRHFAADFARYGYAEEVP